MKVTVIYSSNNIDAAMPFINYCRNGIGLDPMFEGLGMAEFLVVDPASFRDDELFYPLLSDALEGNVTVLFKREKSQ